MRKHRNLSSQKIINKTLQLVKKYGQRKITFSYVAKELGIHSEALYTYFNNRNDLIIHVAIEYFHKVFNVAKDQIIGISGRPAIIKYLLTMRDYGLNNIRLNNMAFFYASEPKVKDSINPIIKLLFELTKPLCRGYQSQCLMIRELGNQILGELVNENVGLFLDKDMNKRDSFILGIKHILSVN